MKKVITIIVIVGLIMGLGFSLKQNHDLRQEIIDRNTELVEAKSNYESMCQAHDIIYDSFNSAKVCINAYRYYCHDQFVKGNTENEYGPFVDDEYLLTFMDLETIK